MAYRQAVSHQWEKSALIISGKSLNYAEQRPIYPSSPGGDSRWICLSITSCLEGRGGKGGTRAFVLPSPVTGSLCA